MRSGSKPPAVPAPVKKPSPGFLALAIDRVSLFFMDSFPAARLGINWLDIPTPALCGFFHWQYAGVLIPCFWSLAVGMIGIANAGVEFALAYVFLVLGDIWSAGFWWTSEFLLKKRPASQSLSHKNPVKAANARKRMRQFVWLRFGGCILIFLVLVLACYGTRSLQTEKELDSLNGVMYPANDPMAPNNCGDVPADRVMLFLGTNVSAVNNFPHTVLAIHYKPAIVVDRRPDGAILVSLNIRDADGKIIVQMDKNNFVVNGNTTLGKPRRPDRSSIEVTDQYGRVAFKARYLNKRAMRIEAIVNFPGIRPFSTDNG